MQTLPAGSFLNLENAASVEALKFTARKLAEQAGNVVKENLNHAALENLTNNLWEKAEYVAREPERRRLREIFAENFRERFRELQPEMSLADNLISEVLSAAATIEGDDVPTIAPATNETGKNETAATETANPASPPESVATAAQEKRDEFLGFVKTDEPKAFAPVAEAEAVVVTTPVSSKAEQETIRAADAPVAETIKPEDESVTEREQAAADQKVSSGSANKEQSPPTAATTAKIPAGSNSPVAAADKTSRSKTETKEPFEFGKCTISLNLTLLPTTGDGNSRKAIVSAASHGSPPEIEFLEITDGEDLTDIADIVRVKLAGFKNGLPAKYIEQLRQSKTNSAKKSPTVRTPLAVPTKTEVSQSQVEKTIGERTSEQVNSVETAEPETNVPASSSAFAPTINRPIVTNEIQGSLF